jgi:hypothetical protein
LPDFNRVVSWQQPPEGVSISGPRNGFLVLTVSNLKEKERFIRPKRAPLSFNSKPATESDPLDPPRTGCGLPDALISYLPSLIGSLSPNRFYSSVT